MHGHLNVKYDTQWCLILLHWTSAWCHKFESCNDQAVQQEGHANRILSSEVTPCSPVNVYQHFKGTCRPSNLPWWRRQQVEYFESSLRICRITWRFVSEVSNVVSDCNSYWRVLTCYVANCAIIRGRDNEFCLHLDRKWTGKDILMK